ncbi:hypothetical protein HWV62_45156 [Athelia sp. TMB]|nr:hypothetical protein HWV62_45156 [Athelia sp. TMB]
MWMRPFFALLSIVLASVLASGSNDVADARLGLRSETNGTSDVQWDGYSLLLRGQRVFMYSGEFHTYRLPVPSLWPDILQKIKAAGLNAISVYTHPGSLNPSRNVTDLNGIRALKPLFEAALQAGIWIVLRPGPYINAETSAGGLPHWMTTEVAGVLRTNASDYFKAWQPYVGAIIEATEPYQITKGGPVIAVQIDNEYYQSAVTSAYFAELEAAYIKGGIVVPFTYNDPGEGQSFVNGTGAVDIYGFDAYPQLFDCSNPEQWNPVTTNYHSYHESTNPSQPFYLPEFQGGSFDAWGPTAPGYAACAELTGASFESVFYRQLWASNVKMVSFYMVYGGTSWGGIPFPGVYTSYDYGSAISENRNLSTTKYAELKRQALFLRSSPAFYKTDYVSDSSTNSGLTNDSAVFAVWLKNPDQAAGFLVTRQNNSTSTSTIDFKATVSTSAGNIEVPQVVPSITLGGREAKVVVTDYAFGNSSVLYSTAQVLFAGKIGARDVLFLYGDSNQAHEASLALTGTSGVKATSTDVTFTTSNYTSNQTIVSFLSGIEGFATICDSSTQLILYADSDTAGTWWNPVLPAASGTTFANYWSIGTNSSVLVGGPYLVRSASLSGSTLKLVGDLATSVRLFVVAPSTVKTVTWNGKRVEADPSISNSTVFVGDVNTNSSTLAAKVPSLSGWKYSNSLPEILSNYSDEKWTAANHTTTNIPFKPYYGDGRILYGCDYGFCENVVLWRGHFNATGAEKTLNLSVNGGEAFAASVWVNDVFLSTSYGKQVGSDRLAEFASNRLSSSTNDANTIEETDDIFHFPAGSLIAGQDNVITIVQDNMGLNETIYHGEVRLLTVATADPDTSKSPRGVRGFQLDSGNFSEWKVQGKLGGYLNYPDKVRGVMNEGGLYGERLGWHLPGFDTASWVQRDLSEGLPDSAAGVGFFVTTFKLDLQSDQDVFLSFTFDDNVGTPRTPYRAYLFVNGWMMGKRVGNLGPQAKFPVHQGILDYTGTNTVAVALWAMEANVTIAPTLALTVDGVVEGGVGGVKSDNPKWAPRDPEEETRSFPLLASYVTIKLDPVKSVELLEDEEATAAAHGAGSKVYVGYTTCFGGRPAPEDTVHIHYVIRLLRSGRHKASPEEFIDEDMCTPVFPNTDHPFREPLVPSAPLPVAWTDCYHASFDQVIIRVPRREGKYPVPTNLPVEAWGTHMVAVNQDYRRRAEQMQALEEDTPAPRAGTPKSACSD